MPDLFHFGAGQRELLGIRHAPTGDARRAVLLCAPLLQEGIRCQRALWSLSESLSAAGTDVLRFDWSGSGDSAGDTDATDVDTLVGDVGAAMSMLQSLSAVRTPRMVGLRSAALPLLAAAAAGDAAADVVLWAPVLDGRALVAGWREQHRRQLNDAGRFLRPGTRSDDDELLGFVVAPRLLDQLESMHGNHLPLPPGSRLLVAEWAPSDALADFVQAQRAFGVSVDVLELDAGDVPPWDDARHFDTQLFPRRSVQRLSGRLAEAA